MNIQDKKNVSKGLLIGGLFFLLSFQVASASSINKDNVINLVNEERLSAGINALVENYKLDEAAMQKLNDMVRNGYFSHTSPKSVTPWYWFDRVGYDYQYAGENLAINFLTSEDQHAAWMKSEDHRKNILNPLYQEIGVAVGQEKIDGKLAIITVQLFGARADFQKVLGEENIEKETIAPGAVSGFLEKFLNGSGKSIAGLKDRLVLFFSTEENIDLVQGLAIVLLLMSLVSNPAILLGAYIWKNMGRGNAVASSLHPTK